MGKSGVGKNDIVGDLVKLNDSINDVIFIIGRKMISFSPPSWPTTGLVSDGLTGSRSARKFFRNRKQFFLEISEISPFTVHSSAS
jgi:hypothetical protein